MSSAATRAKARWNAANCVQLKVPVSPEIADAFKAACAAAGVSMAGELSRFMAEYAAVAAGNKAIAPRTEGADFVSTMKKRRKTVRAVTDLLEQVRDAEETFIGNAPENLQSAPIYENAEEYMSVLGNVIQQLREIYQYQYRRPGFAPNTLPLKQAGMVKPFGTSQNVVSATGGELNADMGGDEKRMTGETAAAGTWAGWNGGCC